MHPPAWVESLFWSAHSATWDATGVAHDPAALLGELRRVLVPVGALALAVKRADAESDVRPARGGPPIGARLFAPLKRWASRRGARHPSAGELRALVERAGFRVDRLALDARGVFVEVDGRLRANGRCRV